MQYTIITLLERIVFKMHSCYKIAFFIIIFSVIAESSGIIFKKNVSKHSSVVDRVMVQLLQDCFDHYRTIVICNDDNTFFSQSVLKTSLISLILCSSRVQIVLFNKVDAFIMSTNSTGYLEKTLSTIRASSYWDIKSTFFMLSDSVDKNCSEALTILQTAWDNNLISAYYICLNKNGEPVIYTFNPYASRAPEVWHLSTVVSRRNNRWTLYSRKYHTGERCTDFHFDRMKYFDGANISIVSCITPFVRASKIFHHALFITDTLSHVLNASIVRTPADAATEPSPVMRGFYLHLANASAEFSSCVRSRTRRFNFSVSYPIMRSGFRILSHHQGFYTPLEKISKFYGKWVLLFTLFVIVITYLVTLISKGGRRYSFATFEILRLLTNLGFMTPINTLPKRIFFCVILIYSLILQATFQGQLSAFLTKNESRRNAEIIDDLQASNYKQVFATVPVKRFLTQISNLEGKVFVVSPFLCVEEIVDKKSSACVDFELLLTPPAVSHKLYLSKKYMAAEGLVFFFRHDCPLEERVNEFFIRLEQTGLTKVSSERLVAEDLMLLEMIEARSIINFRPIALKDIAFIFHFLIIGLTLASVVFILEILFKNYRRIFEFLLKKKNSSKVIILSPAATLELS